VTLRSRSGPRCLILQLVGKAPVRFQSTRSGRAKKRAPRFLREAQLNRRRKWGWQPRSVRTPHPVRQPAMQTMNASLREAGTTCCLAIAVAPSAFLTQGKGRRRAKFSVAAKDLRCGPERLITEQKLGDNPIVDWGFRYRSTRKPRLSCHRRTPLALMERFQT
jgi:hypothetical protein